MKKFSRPDQFNEEHEVVVGGPGGGDRSDGRPGVGGGRTDARYRGDGSVRTMRRGGGRDDIHAVVGWRPGRGGGAAGQCRACVCGV